MSGQKKTFNWKLLTLIAVAFVIGIISKQAFSTEAPYPLWLEPYFKRPTMTVGHDAARRIVARYNPAVHNSATSTNGLGVFLPAKAVITRSWYYVTTATTGHPASRVAFQCEDANNIKTATDMSAYSADTLVEGASTGATSAMVTNIAAGCEINAVITGNVMSTGLIEIYVDYVIHQ